MEIPFPRLPGPPLAVTKLAPQNFRGHALPYLPTRGRVRDTVVLTAAAVAVESAPPTGVSIYL